MKKIIYTVALAALITSCSNNGKKAEAKEAEEVAVATNEVSTFSKVNESSHIAWRASHLGGVQPRYGKIFIKNASFDVDGDKLVSGRATVNMASLTVENFPEGAEETGKLTGHLQSPDFFDVEKYPTSKFELTNVEAAEGDFNAVVTGNLTILDVTKSISFNANVEVSENEITVTSEDFSVDRTAWNLTYNVEGTAGVPVDYLIANDIGFTINITLSK